MLEKMLGQKMGLLKTELKQELRVTGGSLPTRGYEQIKEDMERLQLILFNDDTSEKDREKTNIEFEKLMQELERTTEFQEQKIKEREEWKRINEPINEEARVKMRKILETQFRQNSDKFIKKISKKPILKLILMDKEEIGKKHQNDFKQYVLSNLSLEELRAVFASLPSFRSDQEVQVQIVINCQDKIDELVKNPPKPKVKKPKPTGGMPPPPPPIMMAKKINNSQTVDTNGLFAELLNKRKRAE